MILELYGCTGTPNEGVKWSPEQQFKEVARIEREHPYLKGRKEDCAPTEVTDLRGVIQNEKICTCS